MLPRTTELELKLHKLQVFVFIKLSNRLTELENAGMIISCGQIYKTQIIFAWNQKKIGICRSAGPANLIGICTHTVFV